MTFPLSHPLTLLLPSFLPSQEPSWLNVPNSLVAPGEKRHGSLAKGVQKGTGYKSLFMVNINERMSGWTIDVFERQTDLAGVVMRLGRQFGLHRKG